MLRSRPMNCAWYVLVAVLLPGAAQVNAASFSVPADFANLQEAINAASPGDVVLVSPGSYGGSGNRDLDFHGKDITLRAEGGSASTTIDCQATMANPHRAFLFAGPFVSTPTIEGFTIVNGYATEGGAALISNQSSPVFRKCVFSACQATLGGGAVSVRDGWVSFEDCVFTGNSAASGGAVYLNGAGLELEIEGCVFSTNTATSGGAL